MVSVKIPPLQPPPAKRTKPTGKLNVTPTGVQVLDDRIQVQVTSEHLDALAAVLPEGLVPPGARLASITLEFADEA